VPEGSPSTPPAAATVAAGHLLKIHEVATETGLTPRTIRYYEELGLLEPAARSEGAYRLYDTEDLERLRFIRGLRDDAGFSLAEIGQLLEDEAVRARNRVQFRASADARERTAILADAIEYDRIFPYYQPIIINETGEIDRYECLARIADRGGRIYTPEFFMNIAKKSRLYEKITRAIIRKTFEAFQNNTTEFSINMSVDDFLDPYTLQYIKFALSEFPTVRNRVSFEILETESVTDFEKFAAFIQDMKSVGCKIAIDDFGAGYSNFDVLLKLKLDFLKIDGTLIEKVDTDVNSRIIVENIVNFSRRMGNKNHRRVRTLKDIYDIVRSLGIDYSQGFFLGEPRPAVQEVSPSGQFI